jgi:hypothetical protein
MVDKFPSVFNSSTSNSYINNYKNANNDLV